MKLDKLKYCIYLKDIPTLNDVWNKECGEG
jgi:hypothetical protein